MGISTEIHQQEYSLHPPGGGGTTWMSKHKAQAGLFTLLLPEASFALGQNPAPGSQGNN